MLKAKMQIKASTKEEYAVFHSELLEILKEQQKFQDALEMKIAVADCLDPVQDLFEHVPFYLYHS